MARLGKYLAGIVVVGGFWSIGACSSDGEPQSDLVTSQGDEELRRRVPCASSNACRPNEFCTTETGDCNRPPGCRRGDVCPAVCYGVCRPRREPVPCGAVTCGRGEVCCNESCGVCTRPDGVCTEQFCDPPVECRSDADCRTFSDYCTGCDCRALANGEPDPVCPGPGVQCFVDPCFNQRAACVAGQCELAAHQ